MTAVWPTVCSRSHKTSPNFTPTKILLNKETNMEKMTQNVLFLCCLDDGCSERQ